ncbi:hypothetical protein [Halochromatium sp.]
MSAREVLASAATPKPDAAVDADERCRERRADEAALAGAFLRVVEPLVVALSDADASGAADWIISSLIIHPPTDTRGAGGREPE